METIVTTSLVDEIAFRLEKMILDGTYPPGMRLQQDELCERFGVSRTPIRETLRKLQAQHLVIIVPNKGATVRIPDRQELHEIYVVRAELEGLATSEAAERFTGELLGELDQAQSMIEAQLPMLVEGSLVLESEAIVNAQLTKGNEAFHGVVHDAAGNKRLKEIIVEMQSYFPKDYVWRAQRSSAEIRSLNVDEHRKIRDALEAGNPEEARRAMRDHILHSGNVLFAYLDEHGLWK